MLIYNFEIITIYYYPVCYSQKFQKQIKTNKENMNRIIKVLELNLREGWLLCFREYDVQFFQTLKLRDRSM